MWKPHYMIPLFNRLKNFYLKVFTTTSTKIWKIRGKSYGLVTFQHTYNQLSTSTVCEKFFLSQKRFRIWQVLVPGLCWLITAYDVCLIWLYLFMVMSVPIYRVSNHIFNLKFPTTPMMYLSHWHWTSVSCSVSDLKVHALLMYTPMWESTEMIT